MTITYLETSIFDSPAQVLVNPVCSVGIMGTGLALEFKKRWPQMFEFYENVCNKFYALRPGRFHSWQSPTYMILNFPTKFHWRDPSRFEYIEWTLKALVESVWIEGIESIAFPKLGCGKGGLDWADVKPIMEKYLSDLKTQVYIHI